VVTLIWVTIIGLRQSIAILRDPDSEQHRRPDLAIMLSFSALNLLLDILNVSCFASVDQAIGLETLTTRNVHLYTGEEEASLLANVSDQGERDDDESSQDTEVAGGLNLNMCSAWTHVCADTLRSAAVLVAAGFASLFPSLLTAADADSWAAIVVSVIILISLVPLFEGLYWTCCKIIDIHKGSWDVRHHSERHQTGYGATRTFLA
jgi:Co/Zn/Cd efflux system component